MSDTCKRCGFDRGFITDYDKQGRGYQFCYNCGEVLKFTGRRAPSEDELADYREQERDRLVDESAVVNSDEKIHRSNLESLRWI